MAGLSLSAKALLDGPNGAVSLPIAQSLASRATTKVLQTALGDDSRKGDPGKPPPPKPFADSWRECARPWQASAGAYHTPCLARDIPYAPLTVEEADAAKARGETPELTQICPRGLYELHLVVCPECVAAEETGVVNAACEIHALVALARGAWVIPDPAAATKPPKPAKRPPPPDEPLSERDIAFLRQQMAELDALGITRTLTAEQEADPLQCGPIARIHVVWRNRPRMEPDVAEVAARSVGELDVQFLAQRAAELAEEDSVAYAAASATATSAHAREVAFEATLEARQDAAKRKGRVVVGLHKTANKGAQQLSIDYTTAAHLMTARGPQAVAWVHDGEKAYNQIPLHPDTQRQFAFFDPVNGAVRVYKRAPFGGNQTCTLFCGFTALKKDVLREGLSSQGGGTLSAAIAILARSGTRAKLLAEALTACATANAQATAAGRPPGPVAVGGILDDIAVAINPATPDDVRRADVLVRAVFRVANFRTNGKETFGADGVIEVLGTRADLRRGTLTPKGPKLFETLYQLALLRNLMQRAIAPGAPQLGVPVRWLESVAGSYEWSGATFDWRLRLHRQGLYAAVAYARRKQFKEAFLRDGRSSDSLSALARMLNGDVAFALRHAESGHWRPMRFFDARDLDVVRVSCARCPNVPLPDGEAAIQARVERAFMPSTGQEVVGIASDASIDAEVWGSSVWAVHVPPFTSAEAGAGAAPPPAGEVIYHEVPRGADDSSGTIELQPWVTVLERHGAALRGKFLVMTGDNLGNMYRVNRGRVKRGTPAHQLLMRLYDLAAEHDINFLALWLPRAANQYLDAVSKCRTLEEAQGAVPAGVRLVKA